MLLLLLLLGGRVVRCRALMLLIRATTFVLGLAFFCDIVELNDDKSLILSVDRLFLALRLTTGFSLLVDQG